MRLRTVSSEADAELVAGLAERCWRPHYTPIIGGAQVDYMLARFQSPKAIAKQIADGRVYQIIENDSGPLGYLAFDLSERVFLSKLYVLPEHRGQGIGRWTLEEIARTYPGLEIELTVNKHNHGTIAFYESLGFIKDGPIVADIGNGYVMDDWKMRRPAD